MSLQKMIKERRQILGLKLKDISAKTDYSISHISDMEHGKTSCTLTGYVKLCEALEVDDLGLYLEDLRTNTKEEITNETL